MPTKAVKAQRRRRWDGVRLPIPRGTLVWVVGVGLRSKMLTALPARAGQPKKYCSWPHPHSLRVSRDAYMSPFDLYGGAWRSIFPTRKSAQYQAALARLVEEHALMYEARLYWFYVLEAGVRAARQKGA